MKKIFIRLLFIALLMLSVYTLFFVLAILDLITPEESLAISSIAMFFIFVCGVVYILITPFEKFHWSLADGMNRIANLDLLYSFV